MTRNRPAIKPSRPRRVTVAGRRTEATVATGFTSLLAKLAQADDQLRLTRPRPR